MNNDYDIVKHEDHLPQIKEPQHISLLRRLSLYLQTQKDNTEHYIKDIDLNSRINDKKRDHDEVAAMKALDLQLQRILDEMAAKDELLRFEDNGRRLREKVLACIKNCEQNEIIIHQIDAHEILTMPMKRQLVSVLQYSPELFDDAIDHVNKLIEETE